MFADKQIGKIAISIVPTILIMGGIYYGLLGYTFEGLLWLVIFLPTLWFVWNVFKELGELEDGKSKRKNNREHFG